MSLYFWSLCGYPHASFLVLENSCVHLVTNKDPFCLHHPWKTGSESVVKTNKIEITFKLKTLQAFDVRKATQSYESDSKVDDVFPIIYFKRGIEVFIAHLI